MIHSIASVRNCEQIHTYLGLESYLPTSKCWWYLEFVKEVDMVESVGCLKSTRSISGTPGPELELLNVRIASALNNIQNARFKKKISLTEMKARKEHRFVRGGKFA